MKNSPIAHQQFWHFIFWILALLASTPLLWPRMLPRPWRAAAPHVCGYIIAATVLLSFILLCVSCVRMLARLHNLRTLGQIVLCGLQWLTACGLFAVLAYVADVAPPQERISPERKKPIPVARVKPPPPIPSDVLSGPRALVIPIELPDGDGDAAPPILREPSHLLALEEKHPDLLDSYIAESPRWGTSKGDLAFFSRPWHVVMPVRESGASVHAAFMSISVGQQVPSEYRIVKAGSPLPIAEQARGQQLPDLALELGGSHYLLLAWRGPANPIQALRAVDAAIHEVDSMVKPLAESPTQNTLKALCAGSHEAESIEEIESPILVSEPYAHSGLYQAQILANPGRDGSLVVDVVDSETKKLLVRFETPARFSRNPNELFCYDIPSDVPAPQRQPLISGGFIPDNDAPLFMIPRAPSRPSSPPAKPVDASDATVVAGRPNTKSDNAPASEKENTLDPLPFNVSFHVFFRPKGHKKLEHISSKDFRVISAREQLTSQTRNHSSSPPIAPQLSQETFEKTSQR